MGKGYDEFDAYESPYWITKALLRREPILYYAKAVYDPCIGLGAMAKIISEYDIKKHKKDFIFKLSDRKIFGSDIRKLPIIKTKYHKIKVYNLDVFDDRIKKITNKVKVVILNPPFGLPKERSGCAKIVKRLLDVMKKDSYVAIFQRQQFLEGTLRYNILFKKTPPLRIYLFTRYPQLYREGYVDHNLSGNLSFAWYIFKVGHHGNTNLYWIDDKPKDYENPFLPQEVGMCYCCKYKDTNDCKPRAKNCNEAEKIGKSTDYLCLSWDR